MSLTKKTRKIIWYSVCVIFVISVYLCVHMNARLFLTPYAILTDLIWSVPFEYAPDYGYISSDSLVAITESCSGVKMFASLFLIAGIGFIPENLGIKEAVKSFIAYALKIAALTFILTFIRISLSLKLNYLPNPALSHNIISLTLFFGAACILFLYLNKKKNSNLEENLYEE